MRKRIIGLWVASLLVSITSGVAQSTAFTYQGRLDDGGNPASGSYDIIFTLHDAAAAGNVIGGPVTNAPTSVSNGLFTVTLDFGNQFPGDARWLEIAVRTNGGGAFTTLAPRQPLTSTPYAIQALNSTTAAAVSGSIPASQITGTVPVAQLPPSVVTNGASGVNISGTFAGNGSGVTNLNLALNSGTAFLYSGSFMLASSPAVGIEPYSVISADVNGDGKPDLISANANTTNSAGEADTLTVLTNNGRGGFALSSSPNVGSDPMSVTSADVNGDGKTDLISANRLDNTLTVLTNNGRGNFVIASSPSAGSFPRSVISMDVNGDGKSDLVSTGAGISTVQTNDGSGGFAFASSLSVPFSFMMTSADVNGDGQPDLITGTSPIAVLTNNGNGEFTQSYSRSLSGVGTVTSADVNGDGKPDLISTSTGSIFLNLLTNAGSGRFEQNYDGPIIGSGHRSVTTADVNGDGKPDVIATRPGISSGVTVLTNSGTGDFLFSSSEPVGDSPLSVISADVNGDGRVDLITGNTEGNTLTVLFNVARFTGKIVGDGTGLTAGPSLTSVPAESLTGTVSDARLSANVALINREQTFTSRQTFEDGTFNGTFTGNGAALSGLNAGQLSFGTVPEAVLSPNVALLDRPQTFTGAKTFTAGTFNGNGSGLTALNASQLSSGTVPDARQSANVALLNSAQTFAATKTFTANTGLVVQAASTALELRGGGALKVVGAGVNTTTPVFTHRAAAGNITGSETRIDHPLCNGRSDAILIITYNFNPSGLAGTRNDRPFGLYYTGSRWAIYNLDGTAMPVGAAYNVLVFNP